MGQSVVSLDLLVVSFGKPGFSYKCVFFFAVLQFESDIVSEKKSFDNLYTFCEDLFKAEISLQVFFNDDQ